CKNTTATMSSSPIQSVFRSMYKLQMTLKFGVVIRAGIARIIPTHGYLLLVNLLLMRHLAYPSRQLTNHLCIHHLSGEDFKIGWMSSPKMGHAPLIGKQSKQLPIIAVGQMVVSSIWRLIGQPVQWQELAH